MKVLPFNIAKSTSEAFKIQVDDMPQLYPHLHQHPELQLTYIKKRGGTLVAGDFVGRFNAGDVLLLGANQPHIFRNDKPGRKKENAVAISIFFDESTLGTAFWQLPELKQAKTFFQKSKGGFKIAGKTRENIIVKMEAVVAASGIDKLILFLEIMKMLISLKGVTALSGQSFYADIQNFDGNRLSTIFEHTFKNNHRTIPLQEIAGVANMTPEGFCKYFKMRTRKTYSNFVNELRISNACNMLVQDEKQVSTVCYQVGFNNLSNFNRVFKRLTGMTPVEYKQSIG